jgi:hypothetical protein
MWDVCGLIWWALVGLLRSRAALEAECMALAPTDQCAAVDSTQEASLRQYRSVGLRRPLPVVPQCSRCVEDRPARVCDPVAPCRVQSLLALEIEASRRKANGVGGDTPTDPCYEPCEPTMGRAADSRRTPRAWHRHRAVSEARLEPHYAAQRCRNSNRATCIRSESGRNGSERDGRCRTTA